MSSASEFGKDFGLISEAVVTGRKAGIGQAEWAKLAHDKGLWDAILPAIQGRAEVTPRSRLTTATATTLPATRTPKLKDCDGVYLWAEAAKLFASADRPPAIKKREVEHRDLIESLNDFDLIQELGDEYPAVFASVAELETIISQMVIKQAGGKSGDLLNTGANIFYVRAPENHERVLCVSVHWDAGDSGWGVGSHPASAFRWRAGSRVFQATAT